MTRESGDISHSGKVVSVGPISTKVLIVSESACSACHAQGFCSAAEAKSKEIEVPNDPLTSYSVGEEVDVLLKESMGMKAVMLAYVLPLFILIVLVVSLSRLNAGELLSALCGVLGIAVYYACVYIFRHRIAKEYVFYIRKKSI